MTTRRRISEADLSRVAHKFNDIEQDELPLGCSECDNDEASFLSPWCPHGHEKNELA